MGDYKEMSRRSGVLDAAQQIQLGKLDITETEIVSKRGRREQYHLPPGIRKINLSSTKACQTIDLVEKTLHFPSGEVGITPDVPLSAPGWSGYRRNIRWSIHEEEPSFANLRLTTTYEPDGFLSECSTSGILLYKRFLPVLDERGISVASDDYSKETLRLYAEAAFYLPESLQWQDIDLDQTILGEAMLDDETVKVSLKATGEFLIEQRASYYTYPPLPGVARSYRV